MKTGKKNTTELFGWNRRTGEKLYRTPMKNFDWEKAAQEIDWETPLTPDQEAKLQEFLSGHASCVKSPKNPL